MEQFIKENVSTVRKGYKMMETMLKVIDILQHSDFVAGTTLEKQIGNDTPVKTSLKWLEALGKVKAENHKEELITVKCHDVIYRDYSGQIIPKNVTVIVDGKEYMITNPRLRENNFHVNRETIEKQIQVTRRYYKWVG